jgi:hypothetical protein
MIHAGLVLQHIEPDRCRSYLRDFASMAPRVYLLTRTTSDFGGNVLNFVSEAEAFDAGDCVEVDHDPQTNQLRVLGRRSFDGARGAVESTHFEVLLASRHFI